MAGYSGTPLPKKLGIKPGLTVVTNNAPTNYRRLLGTTPEGVTFSDRLKPDSSFVHVFIKKRSELENRLFVLREKIADTGTVWVSWPKKSSGVPTDVTEDVVRAVALPLGFVDVKVCAVDETWSGLKLMVRRIKRKTSPQNRRGLLALAWRLQSTECRYSANRPGLFVACNAKVQSIIR
jgi:hypothetical protein